MTRKDATMARKKALTTYLLLPREGWIGSQERRAVFVDLPELTQPPPTIVAGMPDGTTRNFRCVTQWRLGFIYMEQAQA